MESNNHFFSHKTHVSLALPFGWEEPDEGTYVFELADVLDEEELLNAEGSRLFNPRWMIELFPLPNTDSRNLQEASKALLSKSREDFRTLRHVELLVDGYPAVCDEFSYRDADYKGHLIHHQAFVLVDNVLFSFTGILPMELQEDFTSAFDDALQSVRFILPSSLA